MKIVPRFPERVLNALGASKYFCDDVLGDLAQEFAIRAEFDLASARRWYYREAWRAAPYFLRNGLRNLGLRDWLGLAHAVVVAMTGATVFRIVLFRITTEIASALGIGGRFLSAWFMAPVFLLINALTPFAGGYIAARYQRKVPLLAAVSLGIVWWAIDIAVIGRVGDEWPALYRYGAPLVALTFTTAGGLFRIWKRRSAPA
jgi:hypothetical protein